MPTTLSDIFGCIDCSERCQAQIVSLRADSYGSYVRYRGTVEECNTGKNEVAVITLSADTTESCSPSGDSLDELNIT